MKEEDTIEMVGECTSYYAVLDCGEDGICIIIQVPRRFADLWLVKLTNLTTTMDEIREYEPDSEENERGKV